ncbi:MAG: pitrilysin family protein, partial [Myxococcota bacterium]
MRSERVDRRLLRAPGCFALNTLLLLVAACGQFGTSKHAWEAPPPPLKVGPIVDPSVLTRSELPNGLRILVLEDHRLPTVSLSVAVARGAGAEDPARAGVATFLAELMNRGAGKRDALQLAQAVDALGANLSASAGWDSMNVGIVGLSRDFPALLEILADVVRDPQLEASEAEKTRREQLAALEADKDDPGTLARWRAMSVLYPHHRYGLPVMGTSETVAGLDAAAARELHKRYLVPGNAIVGVSGDVDPTQVLKQITESFQNWKEGPLPGQAPSTAAETPAARRIVIVDRPELVQARIIVTHEGIDRLDPRRISAGLLNDTLGGSGFSSRLMKELRSEEGLTYGVHSGFILRRQAGPFRVSTFTRVP